MRRHAAFFLSSLFALWAMSVKKFVWFDDLNGWFEKDYLSDPDQLQRSYVLAMHEVYRSHAKANASKADRIEVSQVLIVIGSALLAFMLARVVWAAGLTPRP